MLKTRTLFLFLAVLACVTMLAGCGKKGLTASSSCKDFNNAASQDQDSAVSKIAGQQHDPEAVTPLGRPNINSICVSDPGLTLGEAIRRTG